LLGCLRFGRIDFMRSRLPAQQLLYQQTKFCIKDDIQSKRSWAMVTAKQSAHLKNISCLPEIYSIVI
jgi:hypothetical protein